MRMNESMIYLLALGLALTSCLTINGQDPLASWQDGPSKHAILEFVAKVTDSSTDSFVPPAERIAVFDNDGTLWCEYPVPNQAAFGFDEVQRMLPDNPTWKDDDAVRALTEGDLSALMADHHRGLLKVLSLSHADMTTVEFNRRVTDWLGSARHPRYQRPYTETVYQPMLEVLEYLRANGFETWIVSGGGQDFMRVFAEETYGIPPQQVIGSHGGLKYELKDGKPMLTKTLETLFVDDKEGKPVGIAQFIGRRPIAAFGNSDGDQAMLEYTTIDNPRPSLGVIVHHTDAQREYAYDANPKGSGKLVAALAAAPERGWTIVDMKNDWKQVFPTETAEQDPQLLGNQWLVEDIGGRGVIDNAQTKVEFSADGTVSGSTGLNRFTGKATIAGKALSFGPLATTRRAGPPALMDQERRFLEAMGSVASYEVTKPGIIQFLDTRGQAVLRLSRKSP